MSNKNNKKELEKIRKGNNFKNNINNKNKENELLDKTIYVKDLSNEVKKYNKRKSIRKILIISLSILLILLIISLVYYLDKEHKEQIRLNNIKKEQEIINNINSHYSEYVITNKESNLYNSNNEVIGIIGKNISLSLDNIEINKDTKYFKVKDFEDTYIEYNDVEKIDSLTTYDNRYKNYIVFNENIITKDITSFYDKDNNLIYKFNNSFNLSIIIKDNNRYGVEFNNRLLYVNSDEVVEIKYNYNTSLSNSSGVGVFNYHAFYDETNAEERRNCNTAICHSKAQFKTHLDYFKEHNILTLKIEELEYYIDGKIQLPKSILITIDDGPKTKIAVDMLTEYQMYATIFLVTSWFDEASYYKTDYIELHSHGHNLHKGGDCPGGQGGAIKCLPKETLLEDLRESSKELGGSKYFCYPFYEYNSYSISVLKEAGYTMAFTGEYGDMLTKVGMNKYIIPRFVIMTHTTIKDIDDYLNQIK